MPDEMSVSRIVFDRDENHLPCSDADRDWLIAEAEKVERLEAAAKEQAGPQDNCPLCGRPHDLILDEDGNVHVASPANTTTHRDGGDAKETT